MSILSVSECPSLWTFKDDCFHGFKGKGRGTSLAVQWLRLCISTAGDTGSISGWGTKIPHAGWCFKKKKKKGQEENGKEVCRMYTLSWTDNLFSGSLPHPDLVISSKTKQCFFTLGRKLKRVYKWKTAKDLSRTSGSEERLKRRQGPLSDSYVHSFTCSFIHSIYECQTLS